MLQGKLNTEMLLTDRGLNWTSVRPVYIYGPLNYNPVEEWFFHRLKAGRPIPVPNSGQQVRIGYHPVFRLCGASRAQLIIASISGPSDLCKRGAS